MSLLLWTHSHSTGGFQIHIMKYFVIQKFRAVVQLTVLTSVQPVLSNIPIFMFKYRVGSESVEGICKENEFLTLRIKHE